MAWFLRAIGLLNRPNVTPHCMSRVSAAEAFSKMSPIGSLSHHVRPNPSIKRTVKGLRPSPAAYVKR